MANTDKFEREQLEARFNIGKLASEFTEVAYTIGKVVVRMELLLLFVLIFIL